MYTCIMHINQLSDFSSDYITYYSRVYKHATTNSQINKVISVEFLYYLMPTDQLCWVCIPITMLSMFFIPIISISSLLINLVIYQRLDIIGNIVPIKRSMLPAIQNIYIYHQLHQQRSIFHNFSFYQFISLVSNITHL